MFLTILFHFFGYWAFGFRLDCWKRSCTYEIPDHVENEASEIPGEKMSLPPGSPLKSLSLWGKGNLNEGEGGERN